MVMLCVSLARQYLPYSAPIGITLRRLRSRYLPWWLQNPTIPLIPSKTFRYNVFPNSPGTVFSHKLIIVHCTTRAIAAFESGLSQEEVLLLTLAEFHNLTSAHFFQSLGIDFKYCCISFSRNNAAVLSSLPPCHSRTETLQAYGLHDGLLHNSAVVARTAARFAACKQAISEREKSPE